MPWVSKRQAQSDRDYVLRLVHQNSQLRDANTMLEIGVLNALKDMPAAIVAELRELPTKVLAPIVDQPMSLGVADRVRARELEAQRAKDRQ